MILYKTNERPLLVSLVKLAAVFCVSNCGKRRYLQKKSFIFTDAFSYN